MHNAQLKLWEIDDVCQYLGIPRSSIYKMTSQKSGKGIPHLKIGGLLRFRKADIDEWLDLCSISPVATLTGARNNARSVTARRSSWR